MARRRDAVPRWDHWYVVKDGRVIARETFLDLAIISCLGFEADGVTDDRVGYESEAEESLAFISREDCQATYDYWQEDKDAE